MTSPGGIERGRISIRALPDTSKFSKELRAYLEKLEKTLKLELPVELNGQGIDRSVKQAKEKVAKSTPAKLPVDAENPIDAQFRARLNGELRKLTSDLEVNLPIGVDAARFRAEAGRRIAEIESTLSTKIPLEPASAAEFRRRVRAQIDALQATLPPVQVEVDPQPDGVALLRANVARIAKSLSGRNITFDLNIDRDRIAEITAGILSMGAAVTQLGLAALAGTAAAGGLIAVASAVATAAGALALLPAIGAAAAAPIAALTVGLQGVGDAIKASDDPKKFAEALKNLSPAARETAIAFKQLGPELEKVRKTVQENLFAGVADQIRVLAQSYLPALRDGLAGTATELNRSAKLFADFLKQPQSRADLSGIFNNVNAALRQLAPAGASFAQALRDIAAVGSEFLPALAEGIGGAAESFAAFISEARQSGALKQFISDGLSAFGDLLIVVKNLGTALGGVFRAGQDSGAGFLAVAKDVTKALADFTTSTEGQEAIRGFLVAAREAAAALTPVLEQVALIVGNTLAPLLADLGRAVGPSVVVVLQAIGDALESARPGIEAFALGFASFLEGLAPALPSLGELARVLGETLGAALIQLGPPLGELVSLLADELGAALPELVPAFVGLAEAGLELLKAATPLIRPLSDLARILVETVAGGAKQLAPVIERIASAFADDLAPVLPKLADSLANFTAALAPVAGPLADALLNVLSALLPILPELVDLFTLLLGPMELVAMGMEAVSISVSGLIQALGFGISGLGDFLGAVEDFGKDLPELLANGFVEPHKSLVRQTRGGWDEMTGDAERAKTAIGEALADLVNTFGNAGQGIGFALGGASGSVTDYQLATQRAMDAAREAVVGGVNGMIGSWALATVEAGRAGAGIGTSFSGNVAAGMAAAAARTRAVVVQINDILFGAADRAGAAGLATANGFADGLRAGTGVIAAAAARAMQAAAAHFPSSPAKEGVFSGKGWTPYRGAALADGFADGMLSRLQQVRAAAATLMSTASGSIAIGDTTSGGLGGGGSTVNVYGVPNQTAEQLAALVQRRQAWEARVK